MKVKLFSKNNPLGKKGTNQLDLENEINEKVKAKPEAQASPRFSLLAAKESIYQGDWH